jgi:hypothetical protein
MNAAILRTGFNNSESISVSGYASVTKAWPSYVSNCSSKLWSTDTSMYSRLSSSYCGSSNKKHIYNHSVYR